MAKNLDSLVGVMLNKSNEKTGLRLSDVFYVKPSELRPNPFNSVLFKKESPEYFERMSDDIKERGIVVPLIAKNDGTLLAGHNRLAIAQKLKLGKVPVQYLEDALDEQREKEFIIKDNIFRRQHAAEEWLSLYRTLYPNFEKRLAAHGRPTADIVRAAAATNGKADKSALSKTGKKIGEKATTEESLTVKKIARDTGQTTSAVQKQLHRAGLRNSATQKPTRASKSDKPSTFSSKIVEKYERTLEQFLDKVHGSISGEDAATQRELVLRFKRRISDFQKRLQD
jgi:ParB-like chromosome segregation protein Spo0J